MNVIDLAPDNEWESGADGYIIKAGQGLLEYDWRPHVARADAERAPWGLYWVPDSRYAPEGQKAAIIRAFPNGVQFCQLGFWLDVEKPNIHMTDEEYRKTPYPYYKPIMSIWDRIRAYCNYSAGWYFSPGSWDLILSAMPLDIQAKIAESSDLWLAHYGVPTPGRRGKWNKWSLWQWRAEPDYNRVDPAWAAKVGLGQLVQRESYVIKRPLKDYMVGFTPGDGELPLVSAVEAATAFGWECAMNGGAGFSYTDATHALPQTDSESVQGARYARRLITSRVINPDLDKSYLAPWSIFGYDSTDYYLIVTVGKEGESGKTQYQAAQYAASLGLIDAFLMDSGRSAQIEERGTMLYWPYGPSEKVPQHIGLHLATHSTGGTMKGTAKGTVNIKSMASGELITTLQAGDYLYGDWSSSRTDLINFTHIYRANGTKVELVKTCKASAVNLIVSVEAEPTGGGTTPPPAASEIDYIDVVMKDGSRQKFVPQV